MKTSELVNFVNKMKLALCTSLLILSLTALCVSAKPKVVCYWANWSDLKPEDIDASLCTHLHYAFFAIDDNNSIVDSAGHPQTDLYSRLNALKKKNKNLKVIPSLGGWGYPDKKFSNLVTNEDNRKKFITNSMQVLKKYGFDGLDIDWEYPVCWQGDCTAGPDSDRTNFGIFIKEIHEIYSKQTPPLSISAAVMGDNPGDRMVDKEYDFKALGEYLDYINIMTYDLADPNSKITQHHSPYNLSIANVQYWANKVVPKDKVLMGVPFYGHSFKLADQSRHGEGAPVDGKMDSVKVSTDYKDICGLIKHQGWKKDHGDHEHDPIAYHDNSWIGYDDAYSLFDKSKWINDNGYGGIIIWEISQDDYTKKCCSTANPLLRAINHGLYGTGDAPEKYGCEQK